MTDTTAKKRMLSVCASWQRASAQSAASARRYLERGDLDLAGFCQADAAYQHREAATRLHAVINEQ